MIDQEKLLEMLQEIKRIAEAQQNRLTGKEIVRYLGDDALSEEQMQAIYRYLGENGIKIEGFEYIQAGREPQEESTESVPAGDRRRAEELAVAYLRGDDTVRDRLIEIELGRVEELAGKYRDRNVPTEEVIAEGNLGLVTAMGIVEGDRSEYLRQDGSLNREKFFGVLDMEVVHAMESFIDEEISSKDLEHTMLAKINLLHEATKYLTEELGRVPGVSELSAYTKMGGEEIESIMSLSEDAKRVADTTGNERTKNC